MSTNHVQVLQHQNDHKASKNPHPKVEFQQNFLIKSTLTWSSLAQPNPQIFLTTLRFTGKIIIFQEGVKNERNNNHMHKWN